MKLSNYLYKVIALGALTLCGTISNAVDLGTEGDVWPIAEPDIRKTIVKDMLKVNWDKKAELLKDDAKTFIARLPKRNFGPAEKATKSIIDVSVELAQDIKVPVKDDKGEYSWRIMAKKGDRVNPLATKRLGQLLYFFDGNSPEQVKVLGDLLEAEPLLIMPIEAGSGDLNETSKKFERPVFYAPDYMINQFRIQNLPTIAYQGVGANSLYIETIAYPITASAKDMLADWEAWPKRDSYFAISKLNKADETKK